MSRKNSHKRRILARLLESHVPLTATDFSYVSNPNEYFVALEKKDLIASEWGRKGNARVKYRYVPESSKQKALEYLGLATGNDGHSF